MAPRKPAFQDTEAPTGRSNLTARLYEGWLAVFDHFTDEQRAEVIDICDTYRELTREEQKELADAITGPAFRSAINYRRRQARLKEKNGPKSG